MTHALDGTSAMDDAPYSTESDSYSEEEEDGDSFSASPTTTIAGLSTRREVREEGQGPGKRVSIASSKRVSTAGSKRASNATYATQRDSVGSVMGKSTRRRRTSVNVPALPIGDGEQQQPQRRRGSMVRHVHLLCFFLSQLLQCCA